MPKTLSKLKPKKKGIAKMAANLKKKMTGKKPYAIAKGKGR